MPIYEYRCAACSHRFEEIVHGGRKPACPQCQAKKVEKLISVFAVSGGQSNGAAASDFGGPAGCGTCGDPRGPGSCSNDD